MLSSLTLDFAPEIDATLVDVSLKLHASQVELAALFKVDCDSVDLDIFEIGA